MYWRRVLDSSKNDSKGTWRHLDSLLGTDATGPSQSSDFTSEQYHQYMDEKISAIRERTSDAGHAVYSHYSGPLLTAFSSPTQAEVVDTIRSMPNKQCSSDPLPTWLLKASLEVLAPFLTTLLEKSLKSGEFPEAWRHAIIHPHLKRVGLNCAEVKSYRPVSNLPFLSKVLERLVNKQLVAHLDSNRLMPKDQSAYRRGHSTETAIMKVFGDIVDATANGQLALLCSLDLSAAFDTVDHDILIHRLERSYGFNGQVLAWLNGYLTNRTQSVWWNGSMSSTRPAHFGVPQGSVLGPLLFVLYVADIGSIVSSAGLLSHAYADDSQIYGFCSPDETDGLRVRILNCISAVNHWTAVNRLALNPDKTELLWVSTPRRACMIPRIQFSIEGTEVAPVKELRLLGVTLDESLTLTGHISNVTRSCYYHLRKIVKIRRYLTIDATIQLVRASILSRLDYCNSILLGLPDCQLNRLQSVLNAAARVIFGVKWNEHVTPILRDRLHWLRIPQRIKYKRCWLTYRMLRDPTCPDYLTALIRMPTTTEVRSRLRSSGRARLFIPPPAKTAIFGERSVSRGNPALWNALPDDVTEATSPEMFARRLKTHLFNISYS